MQDRKPINVMFGLTDIDLENILFSDIPDEDCPQDYTICGAVECPRWSDCSFRDGFAAAAADEDNYVTVCIDGIDNRPACPVCGQTAYWQRKHPRSKKDLSAFAAGVRSIGPVKDEGDRYPRALKWVCDCNAQFETPVRPWGNYVVVLPKQGHTTIDAPTDWEPRRAS